MKRVSLATLESKNHEINAIKSGIRIYEAGHAEFEERESGEFIVAARDRSGRRGGVLSFTRDGNDLEHYYCNCGVAQGGALCKHIVAAVLAIQGGIPETKLILGKTGLAETTVSELNTAKAVGSGSLNVFATPTMTALMEQAACNALSDCMEDGQTSVGTKIAVDHIAASSIGKKITAAATVIFVHGRTVSFEITASDEAGVIGKGTHTRVIVDEERFMGKVR